MDTILRQIEMLALIPRYPKKVSALELRKRLLAIGFDIHVRTIQRDLQSLSDTFPLSADENKPIGWCWAENADPLEIPGLDTSGALALQMAADFFSHTLPPSCLLSLQPHLRKARKLLDALDGSGAATWPQKVRIISRAQPLIAPTIEPGVLSVIYEALLNNRRFQGAYRRRGATESQEYEVNPLGLVFAEPIVYLVATLWGYDDVRSLALHRFTSAELLAAAAHRPENFDLQSHLNKGTFSIPLQEQANIKLKALFNKEAALHLAESPLSRDQILEECENAIRIEASVSNTAQLRWWLLGFGDQVEVLEPAELREECKAISAKMAKVYR